ncbi:hypothetical protein L3556_02400 [Candidatus Synechococcus calcipolaris G9]|uniref:Uncharacterized protein n=1 Tax=Candidatus Synechococcus calcipolaris G9 TaxID=1497997 RepID=A0ABT6EVF6_9SYNE|nr:hypothetical protein [Candidatus Synechococcus calcipolaris]MDG2989792.1 hypothetical protein [Candidatus Synechococcus calcipolaris G9]
MSQIQSPHPESPLPLSESEPLSSPENVYLADREPLKSSEPDRDRARAKLAWMLFFLLIAINASAIIIMILLLVIPIQANEDRQITYTYAKDIITLLIASQTGLIGAVLGFYFGSDR